MASAAQKKMAIVCLMLLTVGLIMLLGMADATDWPWPADCTETVQDPRVPNNKCICSKNCACAGKCILESPGSVQACFIDCVLKNDCICDKKYGYILSGDASQNSANQDVSKRTKDTNSPGSGNSDGDNGRISEKEEEPKGTTGTDDDNGGSKSN